MDKFGDYIMSKYDKPLPSTVKEAMKGFSSLPGYYSSPWVHKRFWEAMCRVHLMGFSKEEVYQHIEDVIMEKDFRDIEWCRNEWENAALEGRKVQDPAFDTFEELEAQAMKVMHESIRNAKRWYDKAVIAYFDKKLERLLEP